MNTRTRTTVGAVLAALVVGFVTVLTGVTSDAAITVPNCPATSLTRTGTNPAGINQANNGGTWDLTGAVWNNSPDPLTYPIRSESWTNGCVKNGRVEGNIPRSLTRDQWYNNEDGYSDYDDGEGWRATFTSTSGNTAVVRNTFVSDTEDAFDPNHQNYTQSTYLDHVHTEFIRDDCIENEGDGVPGNMYIKDSLFDGCFTAFGLRPNSTGTPAADADFVVEDSLVYVKPQPLGSRYCSSSSVSRNRCIANGNTWLGSYGIWKLGAEAPENIVVRNTIFRLDMPSYSSCTGNEWPAGTYENVTLVYTGPGTWGSTGDCSNSLPSGVTLTTDVSVWNSAKSAWLDGGSTPTPTPTPSETPSATPTASESPSATTSPTPSDPTATVTVTATATATVTEPACYKHQHSEWRNGVRSWHSHVPHGCS